MPTPPDAFVSRDGRVIYAVRYRFADGRSLIQWLNPDGNSKNGGAQPVAPNTRLITTKPGQRILFGGEEVLIAAVEPYLDVSPEWRWKNGGWEFRGQPTGDKPLGPVQPDPTR